LDVSQKLTAICVVDETGRPLWRGQCATDPGQIERTVRGHAGKDAKIGVETVSVRGGPPGHDSPLTKSA
jgi:transposase